LRPVEQLLIPYLKKGGVLNARNLADIFQLKNGGKVYYLLYNRAH